MMISLAAMVLAKRQPTKRFSYGFDRLETLSGFSNGIFLLFVSLFLMKEVLERLFEPVQLQEAHRSGVIFVAMLAIAVNVVGGLFFREHAIARAEVRHAHEENIYSILVHIGVDVVGNIGVVLSTILNSWGWLIADPLVAFGIVFLIIRNAIPICHRTGKVLLQTTPLSMKDQLDKALREAATLEGVLECRNPHFWTQSPGVFVGSLYVRVRSDANEQVVLSKVTNLFSPLVTHLTVQVEKDDWALPSVAHATSTESSLSSTSVEDIHQ